MELTEKEQKMLLRALRSFLRMWWRNHSKARKQVVNECKVKSYPLKKNGEVSKRGKIVGYRCEICGGIVREKKKFNIHHTIPIGTLNLYNVSVFVNKLFCGRKKLLGLCGDCHSGEHKRLREEKK